MSSKNKKRKNKKVEGEKGREVSQKLKDADYSNVNVDEVKKIIDNEGKDESNEKMNNSKIKHNEGGDVKNEDKSKSKVKDLDKDMTKELNKDEKDKSTIDGGDNDQKFQRDINSGPPGKVITDSSGNIVDASNKSVENNANGKALIGNIGRHTVSDQNKVVIGINIQPITVADEEDVGAFGNIIKFAPNIVVTIPDLKYKTLSDIPIWVKYDKMDNYRYKMYRNTEFDFKQEWFYDVPSLIKGIMLWITEMDSKYDFCLLDEPWMITNVTGKRMIRNLNMTKEMNEKPWTIIDGLYEQSIEYPEYEQYFTDGSQIRKLEIDNLRMDMKVIMDKVSMEMLQTFSRHRSQFTILPEDFSNGLYDIGPYTQLVSAFLDKNYFIRTRATEFTKKYNESRSFVRLIHTVLPIKTLISEYYAFNTYYSTLWSNLWVKPLVDSVTVSFVEVNPYYTFFTNTAVGNPTNRATSKKKFATVYNKTLAAEFLNVLLNLYLDPRGTVEILPYEGLNNAQNTDLPVIAEVFLFMYLFKPQVCTRAYASTLLYKVLRYLVTAERLDNIINVNITQLFQRVGNGLSFLMITLLTDWYVYAISPEDLDADHRALYDNNGIRMSLSNTNQRIVVDDTSGLLFWGFDAYAFQPTRVRILPNEISVSTDMVNMFVLNQGVNANLLTDHFTVMRDFFNAVLYTQNSLFTENFCTIFTRLYDVCATPGYINRFKCGPRTNVYLFKTSSILSFAMGLLNPVLKEFHYNFTDMIVKLFYDDYYLSMIANFYNVHERADRLACNFSRISSVGNNTYYKPYERWDKIREYFKDTFIVDLTANMKKEQLLNLNLLVDGSVIPGLELHNRIQTLYNTYINNLEPESRFCVFNKVSNWALNITNWNKVGVYDGFYITNINEEVTIDEFRIKGFESGVHLTMRIDYYLDKLKFGDIGFKREIRHALYSGMRVFVAVPTFMTVVKKEDNLSSNHSNFKFNGFNDLMLWLQSHPELHSIDSPKIDSANITFEYISNKNPTLNKEYIILEPWGVIIPDAVRKYFITQNYSDHNEVIYGRELICESYLNVLQDQSGEVFNCLPLGPNGYRLNSFVQNYS